jgi:hypothetical protein
MEAKTGAELRQCLFCEKPLGEKKRKDSKFCNEYCRAAYHNPKRAEMHPDIKRINKILMKNFQVLVKALGTKDHVKKKRDQILKQGFSLDYFTHMHKDFFFVYRFGYHLKDDGDFTIFKGYDNAVYKP